MKTPKTAVAALADVTAAIVDEYDVVSCLTRLVTSCGEVLGASATGILVLADASTQAGGGGRLELLAASSHAASELELYQEQVGEGPCVDVISIGAALGVAGEQPLRERWPVLGEVFVTKGLLGVHAEPLRWHGSTFGGLNLFFGSSAALSAEEQVVARAFADVASLTIMHAGVLSATAITREVQEALNGRIVIEQAKGVLAVQESVEPGRAFDLLVTRSASTGISLAGLAERVLANAQRGAHWTTHR
ncbi:ANTAR domain-containing protein [Actinotalea sp. K2]|uniref:ANTAR domain-containing protein n=1 Tax=Actinotalea sp. K2 TaxID=2939438 RepID=UPI0020171CFD|nr:ANTAR domain-containing protein [Actinotalea sp. K2]MCL3862388.1 ANTAR domain-containing protein [Actinotalea sp. K2]